VEPKQGKEEAWNQVKRTRKSKKQAGPNGRGPQAPPQQPPLRKDQENNFSPLISQIEESQEPEKQKSTPPSKAPKGFGNRVDQAGSGVPTTEAMVESGVTTIDLAMVESSKGNIIATKEEEHESECSEEEGQIGESQDLIRRSRRGCKTDGEKREQENFKDKLQGR